MLEINGELIKASFDVIGAYYIDVLTKDRDLIAGWYGQKNTIVIYDKNGDDVIIKLKASYRIESIIYGHSVTFKKV